MIAEWSNWLAAGFGGAWAISLGKGVAAYFFVSLLGGLSWVVAVELGRRAHTSRQEPEALEAVQARMALAIVRWRKPAANW
jgi:hypothetical protein